jgi:hypothetical protein
MKDKLLFRASSLGKLMTESRSKSEVLSETAKTYIQDLFKERELGIYKEFSSRYTDKGIENEDVAIQMASEVLNWEFVVKNETRFNNEWLTGEPDILTDSLLADIKCSWNGSTFPMFDKELKNKDYFWQMQAYMILTGHEQAELVYCLTNTPFQIVEDEVRRTHWKLNLIDEDLDVREAVQASHNFDHLPDSLRVKRFIIKRDNEAIERVKQRVEVAREYYESLRTIFFIA